MIKTYREEIVAAVCTLLLLCIPVFPGFAFPPRGSFGVRETHVAACYYYQGIMDRDHIVIDIQWKAPRGARMVLTAYTKQPGGGWVQALTAPVVVTGTGAWKRVSWNTTRFVSLIPDPDDPPDPIPAYGWRVELRSAAGLLATVAEGDAHWVVP